ncbi:sensor domain-containing diguanylate cyclase [Fundidesulfovibrio magnetotacticus]|nr:sensor domain-containing diguanylate cyclase [Fundidesulfovibrio magnetotacticus]
MDSLRLRSCDREPVHVPEQVQGHGVLLVADGATLRVARAAGDARGLLGALPGEVLGEPLSALFARADAMRLEQLIGSACDRPRDVVQLHAARGGVGVLAATAYKVGGLLVLELEPAALGVAHSLSWLQVCCCDLQEGMASLTDFDSLYDRIIRTVRDLAGIDRVMLYQFHKDFSGEVVAEVKAPELLPFLGHRYPASDIPEPARKLYLKNWLRLIPDVNIESQPLLPPTPPGRPPLDMTHARLRAVSPIHIEYLRNMGVSASLSLSVIVRGELWGLIACHHYNGPKHLCFEVQRAMTLMAQCFSMTLAALLARRVYENRLKTEVLLSGLHARIRGAAALEKLVPRIAGRLVDLVAAEGMAMVGRRGVYLHGLTPDADMVRKLAKWAFARCQGELFTHDRMGSEFPEHEGLNRSAAGVLALRIGGADRVAFLWFRPEMTVEELWGGDPSRPYTLNPETGRIHPRTSFETYRRTVSGVSKPWAEHEIHAARSLVPILNAHILRITESLVRRNRRALKEKNALLESISRTDALTGVLNRRALFDSLEAELRRSRRYDGKVALAMLDVDHFKSVNDRHGHQTGDMVLRAVASRLLQEARTTDVIGRYGGEEFLMVMPETSLESAVVVAERVRAAIGNMLLDALGGAVTVSIGVARHEGEAILDLVAKVDAKLYEAKAAGRNRVAF